MTTNRSVTVYCAAISYTATNVSLTATPSAGATSASYTVNSWGGDSSPDQWECLHDITGRVYRRSHRSPPNPVLQHTLGRCDAAGANAGTTGAAVVAGPLENAERSGTQPGATAVNPVVAATKGTGGAGTADSTPAAPTTGLMTARQPAQPRDPVWWHIALCVLAGAIPLAGAALLGIRLIRETGGR